MSSRLVGVLDQLAHNNEEAFASVFNLRYSTGYQKIGLSIFDAGLSDSGADPFKIYRLVCSFSKENLRLYLSILTVHISQIGLPVFKVYHIWDLPNPQALPRHNFHSLFICFHPKGVFVEELLPFIIFFIFS